MQAQAEPQTNPCLSNSSFTKAGSMCDGSSMGISTVANPHFLNVLKSLVLSLVKGEVNKKVLMPNLIMDFPDRLVERGKLSKAFAAGKDNTGASDTTAAVAGDAMKRAAVRRKLTGR